MLSQIYVIFDTNIFGLCAYSKLLLASLGVAMKPTQPSPDTLAKSIMVFLSLPKHR